MTTLPISNEPAAPSETYLTDRQVWQLLQPIIFPAEPLASPIRVGIQSYPNGRGHAEIEMPANDRRAVDEAHRYLGLAPATLRLDRTWSEGEESEFRIYGDIHFRWRENQSPLLPGWQIAVHCDLQTQVDASAHWSGLLLPPRSHAPAVVVCEDGRHRISRVSTAPAARPPAAAGSELTRPAPQGGEDL